MTQCDCGLLSPVGPRRGANASAFSAENTHIATAALLSPAGPGHGVDEHDGQHADEAGAGDVVHHHQRVLARRVRLLQQLRQRPPAGCAANGSYKLKLKLKKLRIWKYTCSEHAGCKGTIRQHCLRPSKGDGYAKAGQRVYPAVAEK
jgi:hypothetical protein